ncbi:hypothetical protein ACFSQT_25035 [Mesorhizobium calcicola]|uniref:Uncharacterized protein n=1 Tax=Mesorhizobium calcicola TaxID=1300310 RepID=A0ABW4WJN7_9HYPH
MDDEPPTGGISAFDCDILRSAFRASVHETGLAEDLWPEHAAQLVHDFTGDDEEIDPELLAWITQK